MRKFNVLYDSSYMGKQLVTRTSPNQGFNREILDRIGLLIKNMTSKRARTYGIVIGVNFPENKQYPWNNNLMNVFIEKLKKYFKYKKIDCKYLWVMEKSKSSKNIHYHILLLLNGYHVKSFYNHGKTALKIWAKTLNINGAGGLIHYEDQGILLDSSKPLEDFMNANDKLFKWASYIAKIRDRFYMPGVRCFDSSQI